MIICSCNSLSDKDVDKAVQSGVCRLSQVYASRQCRVKCGQCVPNVACRLKEALQARSMAEVQTAATTSHHSCDINIHHIHDIGMVREQKSVA